MQAEHAGVRGGAQGVDVVQQQGVELRLLLQQPRQHTVAQERFLTRLGKRQLVFELTPAGRAAGLREADIAVQVRQGFFGEEVQRIQRGREEVRVYVRYPEAARTSLDALDDFRVALPDGSSAPLFTVARVEESRAYSSIERIDGRRVVTVSADVDEALSTPTEVNDAILASVMPAPT